MKRKRGLVAEALLRQGIDPDTVESNNAELAVISGRRFEEDLFPQETPEQAAKEWGHYAIRVHDGYLWIAEDSFLIGVEWAQKNPGSLVNWKRKA